MEFLDFNYLVVSNQRYDLESLKETFNFFSKIGIRRFIFTVEFDRNRLTVCQMIARMKVLKQRLKTVCPHGIAFSLYADIILSDGIVYDSELSRLSVGNSNYIFLKMPLFCDNSWLNADINHLLFKQKFFPIFSSFQNNIHTNPSHMIDHMWGSKFFNFSLDLNYVTSTDGYMRIMQIVSRNISVLPCISNHLSNYVGILNGFINLKDTLENDSYLQLCYNIQRFGRNLFSRL